MSTHQVYATNFSLLQASGVWYAFNHTNHLAEDNYKCVSIGFQMALWLDADDYIDAYDIW
jgi:hypothetical protein